MPYLLWMSFQILSISDQLLKYNIKFFFRFMLYYIWIFSISDVTLFDKPVWVGSLSDSVLFTLKVEILLFSIHLVMCRVQFESKI